MRLTLYFYETIKNIKMINNEVSITHYDGQMSPDVASTSRNPNKKRFRKLEYALIFQDRDCVR